MITQGSCGAEGGRRVLELRPEEDVHRRVPRETHLLLCPQRQAQLPSSLQLLAGLAAYTVIGSWYKVFSRAKSGKRW